MFRKSVIVSLMIALLSLMFTTQAQAVQPNRGLVKDHQYVGNDSLFANAPAGVVKIHYRAVYFKHVGLFDGHFVRTDRVRFKQKKAHSFFNGFFPFGTRRVIYHVRVIDDSVPPYVSKVKKYTFEMLPYYYAKTFYLPGRSRAVGLYPRFCVRVQFDIQFNPDWSENMHCKEMK